jgi:hypothetical protein
VLNVPDAYNDPRFNGKVDIDTSMPVLCIPIKDNEDNTVAVI